MQYINGRSLSLPAYGRVGQGRRSLAAHFAKRNTKNCGGEKRRGESEGGQKFLPRRVAKRLLRGLPPNPLPSAPEQSSVRDSASLHFLPARAFRFDSAARSAERGGKSCLVDLMGFEPTTSSMPSRRANHCATGPERDDKL